MPGSGKSVLAAEAIRDPEITLKYFPDGVFWFRVGMLDPEKLLNRIKILLEKLNTPQVKINISFCTESWIKEHRIHQLGSLVDFTRSKGALAGVPWPCTNFTKDTIGTHEISNSMYIGTSYRIDWHL